MTRYNAIYQGQLYSAYESNRGNLIGLRTKENRIGYYKVSDDLYVTQVEYKEIEAYYGVEYSVIIAGVEVAVNWFKADTGMLDVNTTDVHLRSLYKAYDVRDRFDYDYLISIEDAEHFTRIVYPYFPPDFKKCGEEISVITKEEFLESWKKEVADLV